ncbi:DNA alkylation repair protein [Sulfurimonas sp. SAG-AH-194-C20]|nr:DNA alkylation repair protein [Sulfurimonas sp. SAG-AH-194-C20]MDF1878652.1 DNA alkylation repair protein [Sulfurimonas sp. SAG-AH-194-C20]
MAEPLKNLYSTEYIELLCKSISLVYSNFNSAAFTEDTFNSQWEEYELKERMHHIATTLGLHLPKEYSKAIDILCLAFKKMNYAYGLENMIYQDFVEIYGLDFFDTSMKALEIFTVNSSSEFAIRVFILKYEDKTMSQMLVWATHKDEHIRRLASEGSRSRLPWAIALPAFKANPTSVIEILELLKDDSSAYVRKSVANNLNDISKDNPQLVKELTKKWIGFSKDRDALLKHGCRTLLKASDSEVLALFGFTQPTDISLENFTLTTSVKMGEELEFSFDIKNPASLGKLRIEFVLGFLRKNKKHNKKVFKICEGIYKEKSKKVSKSYSFRPISTRVYYEGEQKLSILINGVIFKEVVFNLD